MYTLSFFTTYFILYIGYSSGLIPNPCCDIVPLTGVNIPAPFEIVSFHFTDLAWCQGRCVATLRYKVGTITTELCVNGFHLRAFFIRILSGLDFSVHREELDLLNYVRISLEDFLSAFKDTHDNSESVTNLPAVPDLTKKGSAAFRTRKVGARRGDLWILGSRQ
ncbi:JM78 [macacine gammaherpesvirus 11]|uniref:JM78 n=2 Tax=macacine gammaherpesvirus 11 TaxID=2560570 RepID=G9JMQ6_9GAMA|nr:JM78 [Macaca fuscata rhadinovirus]AAT00055.1 JM78 [Macaca fuscata rhadinovirus]AEW87603.1 JM78 [Macaca fuscata rhadinovirus]AEW87773.1 JM78 [Macaca fuscata rhadinovirus]